MGVWAVVPHCLYSVIAGEMFYTDYYGQGERHKPCPIGEEQLSETKLIKNSFLFNNRIEVSVSYFYDRVRHR